MAFFKKIFEGKPLKRIEIKAGSPKFRIRASRTGGVNAAVHPLKGLTFNTKHGLRVSKTFKGLTLGFQRSNAVVRGRWSTKDGLFNLNLSKSGFSLSGKSKFGTYNFKNPNRSSFKFAGVQLRGKNAKGLAFIFLIPELIKFFFVSVITLIKFIIFIIPLIINLIVFALKLSVNLIIILLRLMVILVMLIYELILFIIIDIPRQIFTKEIIFSAIAFSLVALHWLGFIMGLLTTITLLTAISSVNSFLELVYLFGAGLAIFILFTGIGWLLRYFFLQDCHFFPFIKSNNS